MVICYSSRRRQIQFLHSYLPGLDEDSKSFSIQCFRQQKTIYWDKGEIKHCCLDFILILKINDATKPYLVWMYSISLI